MRIAVIISSSFTPRRRIHHRGNGPFAQLELGHRFRGWDPGCGQMCRLPVDTVQTDQLFGPGVGDSVLQLWQRESIIGANHGFGRGAPHTKLMRGQTDRQTSRQTERQTDKQAGRQAGIQAGRQAGNPPTLIHTHARTHAHTQTHTHTSMQARTGTHTHKFRQFCQGSIGMQE